MTSSAGVHNLKLLELLAAETDNDYVSNLFYVTPFFKISRVVRTIPPNAYSLTEWNEAIRYLLREKMEFATPQEAAQFLCEYGREKPQTPNDLLQATMHSH